MRIRKRNSFWKSAIGAGCVLLIAAGCQQQMANQPSYRSLEPASFFPDGRSARPLVAGTVPRGHLRTDTQLFTGRRQEPNAESKVEDNQREGAPKNPPEKKVESIERNKFVDAFPFPITKRTLEFGYERFMIYCSVCHDPLGTGRGKIVERGFTAPKTYHSDRLRDAPVGYFFAVISEGYGSMPSYAGQISPRDRWAIVAYIRALQLSQHFPIAQLTAEMRAELEQSSAREAPP